MSHPQARYNSRLIPLDKEKAELIIIEGVRKFLVARACARRDYDFHTYSVLNHVEDFIRNSEDFYSLVCAMMAANPNLALFLQPTNLREINVRKNGPEEKSG